MFARGTIVGACRLLGRGRGFAGVASAFALPLLVADAVLAAADTEEREADVDGREVERCVLVVVRAEDAGVTRDVMGREGVGWTDAAEGGRETVGRVELVPLKDVRDDDREGVWLDGARTAQKSSVCIRNSKNR